MNSNLDPIRILWRKFSDLSLEIEGARTLKSAATYLEKQGTQEEKIALWIEGRL